MKITDKHRLFVEAYDGCAETAARIAGFEGVPAYLEHKGNELLADPTIREAIRQRSLYLNSTAKVIADRTERQAFWTSIMRNKDPNAIPQVDPKTNVTKVPEEVPMSMRLKASELLGKSETDFIERVDVTHNLSISDVIKDAYAVKLEDIDSIEAEYERQRAIKNSSKQNTIEAELVVVKAEPDGSLGDNISEPILSDFV